MATARLVPSTYYLSNSQYLAVNDASNMYTNIDSTNFGTITHNRASTNSTYYAYLRGFNFDDIPSTATINSWEVKLKAYATGHTTSTSSSYQMSLSHGTTQIGSTYASGRLSTSTTTFTFDDGSLDWEDIVNYGSNFSIRIPLRRASSNTQDIVHIYGAEITVDYTVPDPVVITSTLSGNGTINPSGAYNTYKDLEYTLTITPTNASDTVTVTNNGVDVTSQLVAHGTEFDTNRVLGEFTLVSGGFNSGQSHFEGLEGKGVNATQTTSNYYSSGSGTIAVFTYDLGFDLPSNANINRVYCQVNGHAESTSNSNEYMCVQLISGSTELSEEINFKNIGTSNTTITLEAENLPTVSQLASMKLQCRLGYYGGAINGATCYVEYDTGGALDHYTYTFITTGDATIAVVIGGSGGTNTLYLKYNGAWVEVSAAYKKVNGSWVQQSDLTTVFDSTKHYVRGGN